jgi:hypothetical protein
MVRITHADLPREGNEATRQGTPGYQACALPTNGKRPGADGPADSGAAPQGRYSDLIFAQLSGSIADGPAFDWPGE